jgi:hypothetical protein
MNWSDENCIILKEWMEKSSGLRWIHLECKKAFTYKTHLLSYPLLILSVVIGMSSFATISMQEPTIFEYCLQILFAIGNLIVAILSAILKYSGYAELSEQHKQAFIESSKLYRQIHLELSLPIEAREDYITFCRKVQYSYDKLINNQLDIPNRIIKSFNKTFPYCKNRPDVASGLLDLDTECFETEKREYRMTNTNECVRVSNDNFDSESECEWKTVTSPSRFFRQTTNYDPYVREASLEHVSNRNISILVMTQSI